MGGRSRVDWAGRLRGRADRGATAVEYALGVALLCVAALGAIDFMTSSTSDELEDRSANSGAPDVEAVWSGGDGGSTGGTTGGTSGGTTDGEEEPTPEVGVVSGVAGCRIVGAQAQQWGARLSFDVRNGAGELLSGYTAVIEITRHRGKNGGPIESTIVETVQAAPATGTLSYTRSALDGNGNPQDLQITFRIVSISGSGVLWTPPPTPITAQVNSWVPSGSPTALC